VLQWSNSKMSKVSRAADLRAESDNVRRFEKSRLRITGPCYSYLLVSQGGN
jgi:hypothetical protein